jgi:hypothetical protein
MNTKVTMQIRGQLSHEGEEEDKRKKATYND